MNTKIQAFRVTYDAVGGGVSQINTELDIDFPYLVGIAIFLPDTTNIVAPVLSKTRIGGDYYLPDDFPMLAITNTIDQGVAPNERFLTLLDTVFHKGKLLNIVFDDSGASVNYEIDVLCLLSSVAPTSK